jgi:nitroimidazol reductase NimA-like FMN-containing flavoprotein (pyridoxamine 5'-phosphate oxidase superfamily)
MPEVLEVLSREECLELLAAAGIGRIAVSIGALPVILPVHIAMLDGDTFLRTGPGTKLDAAMANAVVALEADAFSAEDGSGWSVLVQGMAAEVTDPATLERAAALPLPMWPGGDAGGRIVRIRSQAVSGRRLRPATAAAGMGTAGVAVPAAV